MDAKVGVSTSQIVAQQTKGSAKLGSICMTSNEHNLQTVIGCAHVFSNGSQTFLEAYSQTFYPLHVALTNFRRYMRRLQILYKATVFPTIQSHSSHVSHQKKLADQKSSVANKSELYNLSMNA